MITPMSRLVERRLLFSGEGKEKGERKMKNLFLPLALAALAVMACNEQPTEPDGAALAPVSAFGKPDGKPGGGGKPGGDSGDIALTVVFTDEGTGIRSDSVRFGVEWPDARYTYVDGEDFVSAKIKSSGQFYFQAFAGRETGKKRDPVLRGVTVDLSHQEGDLFSPDDLADFKADLAAAGDSWPVFTSDVTLHTRNTDGGMYTMEVGSTLVDGGKIGFNDYGNGDAWEWRLLFDTRVDTDGDGVADHPDGPGLCVIHPDDPDDPHADTWVVVAEDGACGGQVDGITELWRGPSVHVADFHTPMHLTLKARNP